MLKPVALERAREEAAGKVGRRITDAELASYLMYPKVFVDYAEARRAYGDLSLVPTPAFFYGLGSDDELSIDIERGKTLIIRLLTVGDADAHGNRRVFFELNGQPRSVAVPDRSLAASAVVHRKAERDNPDHVAAPMPGLVASVAVEAGGKVEAGALLLTIEAMKMETAIHADRAARIGEVVVPAGTRVDTDDLLVVLEAA